MVLCTICKYFVFKMSVLSKVLDSIHIFHFFCLAILISHTYKNIHFQNSWGCSILKCCCKYYYGTFLAKSRNKDDLLNFLIGTRYNYHWFTKYFFFFMYHCFYLVFTFEFSLAEFENQGKIFYIFFFIFSPYLHFINQLGMSDLVVLDFNWKLLTEMSKK